MGRVLGEAISPESVISGIAQLRGTSTVVVSIEGIVNSRPLTYIYDDDVEEVLTPSHLLLGRCLPSTFDQPFDEGMAIDNEVITRRTRYLRSLTDHYWRRFKEEYLLELRGGVGRR